jgi:hypothetical protein
VMELPAATCKAKYRWTRLELQRAMQHHYRLKLRREVLLLAQVFSVILLIFIAIVVLGWLLLEGSRSAPPWSLIFVIVFCFYWLGFDRLNAWRAGRGFEKRPDANTEIEWEFSSDKITTVTALGKGDLSWKYFPKVIETNDGFLFYPLKNLFHWIPVTAFASADCIEQLRNLIRENATALVDKRTRR